MKGYLIPLSFIGLFFFAIGFAFGINGFLTPVLKGAMDITPVVANLLIVCNFLPFLVFSHPASWCIARFGYRRTMALSFALFAVAFALFIPAASLRSLPFFLVACLVSGIANTVLQASVNPYCTILGPIESAAQRISVMGICNKLAWPTATAFMMLLVGQTDVTQIQLSDLRLPFAIIVAIFVVLCIVALLAPLPEVQPDGPSASTDGPTDQQADGRTSIWQFPNLVWGAVALFLYVGVETISLSTVTDYMADRGLMDTRFFGLIPAQWMVYTTGIGMTVGYVVGATCIPRLFGQVAAMRACAMIALVGSVLVATVADAELSVCCIFLMALGCSLMWPALWPMAMEGLGPLTGQGAALLTMSIAGGAVMPLVRAWAEQATGSYQQSYWVCVPCFAAILCYGMLADRHHPSDGRRGR